ncbi:MAG: DUF4145 domain-containing protein [Gammaproteobacteria bacterium]|nr:DUF4145 domain-containing protein [Gammaproteobacteria bacterium]
MTTGIRKVSFCPHCSNTAPQELVYTQRFLESSWDTNSLQEFSSVPCSTFVATCETCYRVILYGNPTDVIPEKEFCLGELEYPKFELHNSVPKKIREIYDEGSRIKWTAPNLFAVQIRKALEELCHDRKANGQYLNAQLKDLADRSEIPDVLVELAHILRLLGNKGAHSSTEGVHPSQVDELDEFFRVIIEYVYVAPGKLKTFREKYHW